MVNLLCAIVGMDGPECSVHFDETNAVAGLKQAINMVNKNKLSEVDASDLQLFPAKEKDGVRLSAVGEDAERAR
ncbi:hypothetical protein P3T76_007766 [Phytophthora citrophthora]|uniref:Crinkler effector protein N-terminal domain-containing protein n=1 Tax=Phytophthora citrophthora TaxID=4793 RepID=A0AAD9LLI9_9STRA|nr:hypothetical protein P3T76_007766 [Phytophthora citrophthora]